MTDSKKPTPIPRHVVYSLPDFQTVSKLGKAGLRRARQDGLKVRYCNNRAYVLSDDFFDYLDRADTKREVREKK